MKRPNRRAIETDISDTLLELRLPATHDRFQIRTYAVAQKNPYRERKKIAANPKSVLNFAVQNFSKSRLEAFSDGVIAIIITIIVLEIPLPKSLELIEILDFLKKSSFFCCLFLSLVFIGVDTTPFLKL